MYDFIPENNLLYRFQNDKYTYIIYMISLVPLLSGNKVLHVYHRMSFLSTAVS